MAFTHCAGKQRAILPVLIRAEIHEQQREASSFFFFSIILTLNVLALIPEGKDGGMLLPQ